MSGLPCRVYWGSHGCGLVRGHDGPHVCCPGDPDGDHELGCSVVEVWTPTYGEDAFPGVDPRGLPGEPPPGWDWNKYRPGCWS